MRIQEITESDALSKIVKQKPLGVRLSAFIKYNFDSFDDFIAAVKKFEKYNPIEAERIASSGKMQVLVSKLSDRGIKKVRMSSVRNNISSIDYNQSINDNTIVDENGNNPKFLYRYVSSGELEKIENTGYMHPSEFYNRIHASVEPKSKYSDPGGSLLAIEYSPDDNWSVKLASDDVYAVTYNKIPVDRIRIVEDMQ